MPSLVNLAQTLAIASLLWVIYRLWMQIERLEEDLDEVWAHTDRGCVYTPRSLWRAKRAKMYDDMAKAQDAAAEARRGAST